MASGKGALQRVGDEGGVQTLGDAPAEDRAAKEIDDHRQIEPTLLGRDVGDVADQVRAGLLGRIDLGKQVGRGSRGGIDPGGFRTIGRAGTDPQARCSHDARHPVDRAGRAGVLQLAGQARAAVATGVRVGVDRLDAPEQPRVGLRPGRGTTRARGVVAAAGHAECVTEFADGKGALQGSNHRMPLVGSSERMLMAFFKISRWRRRYSTSRCRRRISAAGSAKGETLWPGGCVAAADAPRPLPRARSRQLRSEFAETPRSAATRLSGRPLRRTRSTAPCRKAAS